MACRGYFALENLRARRECLEEVVVPRPNKVHGVVIGVNDRPVPLHSGQSEQSGKLAIGDYGHRDVAANGLTRLTDKPDGQLAVDVALLRALADARDLEWLTALLVGWHFAGSDGFLGLRGRPPISSQVAN